MKPSGRYDPVDRRMWGDAKFQSWDGPPPNTRYLWIYLLTNPHGTGVRGVLRTSVEGIAAELGWSVRATEKCMQKLVADGVVKLDKRACVVWIVNRLRHDMPQRPHIVEGWRHAWAEIPQCPLKDEIDACFRAIFAESSTWIATEWERCCGRVSPALSPNPSGAVKRTVTPTVLVAVSGSLSPTQEQEQEQEPPPTPSAPVADSSPPTPKPRAARRSADPFEAEVQAGLAYAERYAAGLTHVGSNGAEYAQLGRLVASLSEPLRLAWGEYLVWADGERKAGRQAFPERRPHLGMCVRNFAAILAAAEEWLSRGRKAPPAPGSRPTDADTFSQAESPEEPMPGHVVATPEQMREWSAKMRAHRAKLGMVRSGKGTT